MPSAKNDPSPPLPMVTATEAQDGHGETAGATPKSGEAAFPLPREKANPVHLHRFAGAPTIDGNGFTKLPHKVYEIGDMNFSLKPNGAAVDAGCNLPNLNDDFTGKAHGAFPLD